MKELVLSYGIPVLYIIGMLIIIIRYRRAPVAVNGFTAFIFFLLPSLIKWLIPESTSSPGDIESFTWISSLIGLLIMIGVLTNMAKPVITKSNPIFILGAVIVVLLTLLTDAIVIINQNDTAFLRSVIKTSLWTSGVMVVLLIFGSYSGPNAEKPKIPELFGMIIMLCLFVFAFVIFAKAISGSWWMVVYGFQYLLTCFGFAFCALVILNRYGSSWFGKVGIAAFILLSIIDLLVFSHEVTNALPPEISEAVRIALIAGWLLVIIFFAAVPASRIISYPPGRGFRITQTRGIGIAVMIAGLAVCGWQLYEVNSTDHFTFWIIKGFIPVPVILLGILLFLGGLIAFVKEYP